MRLTNPKMVTRSVNTQVECFYRDDEGTLDETGMRNFDFIRYLVPAVWAPIGNKDLRYLPAGTTYTDLVSIRFRLERVGILDSMNYRDGEWIGTSIISYRYYRGITNIVASVKTGNKNRDPKQIPEAGIIRTVDYTIDARDI